MRAIVWTAYGPPEVLQLRDVPKPAPKANEVLVKIHATTVTAGDCEMRRMELPLGLSLPMRLYNGVRRPTRITILGQELAGEVEAVGEQVRSFRRSDAVFGGTGFTLGAYAEYICLPENGDEAVLALKPANLTYEEAAAIPLGGLEALHFLRRGEVRTGEQLVVVGAGGSIGTAAVQICKALGGRDRRGSRREIGDAARPWRRYVIDYTARTSRGGPTYDVIFDVVGKGSFSARLRALKPGGRYLAANPSASLLVRSRSTALTGGKKVIAAHRAARPRIYASSGIWPRRVTSARP
jgi:NADPH:quinone reductase-like Zn-dependent oxidoreductase